MAGVCSIENGEDMTTSNVSQQISENLMLVSLTVSMKGLLGDRKDKKATDLVESTFKVAKGNSRALKPLISTEAAEKRAVSAAYQNMKIVLDTYTFPYKATGMRALTAAAYPKYKEEIDKAVVRFWEAVNDYQRAYPRLILERKVQLGELFDYDQYPPQHIIKDLFDVKQRVLPFPQSDSFFVKIAQDAADSVKKNIEEDHQAIVNDACEHLMAKVEMNTRALIEKVSAFKEKVNKTDKLASYFKNSSVDHLKDTAELIDKLNFTNDPNLDMLARKCRNLARYSADVLKENKDLREEIVNEGTQLLQSLDTLRTQDANAIHEAMEMADFMA